MYAYTLTAIALLSSLAAAQIPGLPSCAAGCVGDSFGSCGALDVQCICKNTELISTLSCCVSKACNKDDQDSKEDPQPPNSLCPSLTRNLAETLQFANSLCGGEGGGANNLPTAASCAGQDSASSTAAAQSSGGSSADAASSTGSVTSSASGDESSGTSTIASDETTQLSGSATASSTDSAASETDASSTTSRPAESTGGADGLVIRLGSAGLGVVVAGVMAAL